MWPSLKETADLVKFTLEIFNGKLYFLWTLIIILVCKWLEYCLRKYLEKSTASDKVLVRINSFTSIFKEQYFGKWGGSLHIVYWIISFHLCYDFCLILVTFFADEKNSSHFKVKQESTKDDRQSLCSGTRR